MLNHIFSFGSFQIINYKAQLVKDQKILEGSENEEKIIL